MKKFLTLLLAAAMTLSLAACGSKTDDNSGNNSQPASALELLNAVWANYSDDDKFPAAGGDFDEANMTEDAPGNFSVEDGDALGTAETLMGGALEPRLIVLEAGRTGRTDDDHGCLELDCR